MARKVEKLTMPDTAGRDAGKTFVLTEMAADQGERWALRALLALTNTGVELPDGAAESGFAGIAAAGLQALGKLPYEVLDPLLTDMWACVKYEHKPGAPLQSIIEGENSQIEEVATRFELRLAVLKLHMGFFRGALPSITASRPQALAS
jgi:hypothetical protein